MAAFTHGVGNVRRKDDQLSKLNKLADAQRENEEERIKFAELSNM